MSAEASPARPLAPAFIVGALKGLGAGALLAFMWLALTLVVTGVAWRLSVRDLREIAMLILGGGFAGAILCGFDAAARRIPSRAVALACRLAGGLIAPAAAASPWFGLTRMSATGRALSENELHGFALTALGLAAGQILAGAPVEHAHEPQGCFRVIRLGMATPIIVGFGVTLGTGHEDLCAMALGAALMGLITAGLFWFSQVAMAPVARRLAYRLEPELEFEGVPDSWRLSTELASANERILAALVAPPGSAEGLRHEAFQALDRADSLRRANSVADREKIALRRAELFLMSGDLARAEELAGAIAFEPALRAEVARRRGDLDGAERFARAWHDGLTGDDTYRARSARANALRLLALVRADQGRKADAKALLEQSRGACASATTVFHHLTSERVHAYIEACIDRSPPA